MASQEISTVMRLFALALFIGSAAAFSAAAATRDTARMEAVVRQYFEGVNQKDPKMIRECFGDSAKIWDVCALKASSHRTVQAEDLVDRCMDFVTAHPGTFCCCCCVESSILRCKDSAS